MRIYSAVLTLLLAAAPATLHAAEPSPADRITQGSWPRTIDEARAEAEAKGKPEPGWPEQEIELARARCTQILKSIDAVAVPEAPIRQGECGAPAPVRLMSFGRNPAVAISPPPVLTCDMAAALHSWFKDAVQPLARKHLGQPVVTIESMSDYSCRNAYGRVKTRLSEHGRANALDIRGFVTQSGDMVTLLDDWGMTSREIAAAIAIEKKAAAKLAAERAAEAARAKSAQAKAPAQDEARPGAGEVAQRTLVIGPDVLNRRTLIEGLPRVTVGGGDDSSSAATGNGFGVAPSKLGGPKPPRRRTAAVPPPAPVTAASRANFLRQSHEAACRIFGTVLGPEANNAHRNHFHVDMAERTTGAFCE